MPSDQKVTEIAVPAPSMGGRLTWADLMRVMAVFAVVATHVSAAFRDQIGHISWPSWWAANIYDGLAQFAVPVFIALSGYLLLDKDEGDRDFFIKRFNKVLIPLVAWSIIFEVYKSHYDLRSIFTVTFLKEFLSESVYFHLYFLYIIIGLYLLTPILRRMLKHASMRDVYYYLALWFVFTPLVGLGGLLGYSVFLPVQAATGYLGYYIFGYAVKKTTVSKRMLALALFLSSASLVAMVSGSYFLSSAGGKINNYFIDGLSITMAVYSMAAFVLLRELFMRLQPLASPGHRRAIGAISSASLGIYLVHPVFLGILLWDRFYGIPFYSEATLSPVLSIPIFSMIIFAASLAVVLALQRIPLVKRIVP